jgi:hypothetical protein
MEVENKIRDAQSFRDARRAHRTVDDGTIHPAILNRIAIIAAFTLGGFLIGYIPMWLASAGYQTERESMVKTLRPSVLQNDLATATINARRGEFEQARQQASSFFTDLRAEVQRDESAFVAEQHDAMQSILGQRDETITLLARNDPSSADRLTDLYFNYLQAKNSAGK